jgi:hypothetical protein
VISFRQFCSLHAVPSHPNVSSSNRMLHTNWLGFRTGMSLTASPKKARPRLLGAPVARAAHCQVPNFSNYHESLPTVGKPPTRCSLETPDPRQGKNSSRHDPPLMRRISPSEFTVKTPHRWGMVWGDLRPPQTRQALRTIDRSLNQRRMCRLKSPDMHLFV